MMLTQAELQRLLHPVIRFGGVERSVELRLPSCADILPLLMEPHLRIPQRLSTLLPSEFKRFLRTFDGRQADIEIARAIFADAEAAVGLLQARRQLLEAVAEQGLVFASCPHCRNWEARLSVVALTVALQAGPWPIVEDGLYLAMPSLCDPLPPGDRPSEPPPAARVRFDLPSRALDIPSGIGSGELQSADREHGRPLADAWKRWTGPAATSSPGREQWRPDVPGFRAMLRLSVALTQIDGRAEEASPGLIEAMPLADFYFLDTLHYVTTAADASGRSRTVIACERCGQSFLPILATAAIEPERTARTVNGEAC
jgi:hypothetical protein